MEIKMPPLFWEIHEGLPQQGPGDNESTLKALKIILNHSSFGDTKDINLLDIGCGPGRQTIALAKALHCQITAIDNHQSFLDEVASHSTGIGLSDNITVLNQSMDDIKLTGPATEIIWSEGAIYIMGFEKGLNYWKEFLKPGGYIAVSEMSWFTDSPSDELKEFWNDNYPAIKIIEEQKKIIKESGFNLLESFKLPSSSWVDNYYNPIEKRIADLRLKYKDDSDALKFFDVYYREIEIFKKYSDAYGYTFYIMQVEV